ncbi:hypothetical protein L9F63_004433, partial [Diploptera punctata]
PDHLILVQGGKLVMPITQIVLPSMDHVHNSCAKTCSGALQYTTIFTLKFIIIIIIIIKSEGSAATDSSHIFNPPAVTVLNGRTGESFNTCEISLDVFAISLLLASQYNIATGNWQHANNTMMEIR